jgi:hypothetical protein
VKNRSKPENLFAIAPHHCAYCAKSGFVSMDWNLEKGVEALAKTLKRGAGCTAHLQKISIHVSANTVRW